MKRIVTGVIAGLCLAFAASAAASTPIGNCTLHSWQPENLGGGNGSGYMQSHGAIDGCPNYEYLDIVVCIQVQTPSGGWTDKSGSCRDEQGVIYYNFLDGYSWRVLGAGGHWYRTKSSGNANGHTATYYSSSWRGPW